MSLHPCPPARGDAGRLPLSYVLPLRRQSGDETVPAAYLRRLCRDVDDVIVVDGSPPEVRDEHRRAWATLVDAGRLRVLTPDPPQGCGPRNGKVAGVIAGVRAAGHRAVVVADDDVRHDRATLAALLAAVADETTALARPTNVLVGGESRGLPWHARWDTARTLLNRSLGRDHPGTLALDRDAFLAADGYADDVLFENLELARTLTAAGGGVVDVPHVYVPRVAPSTRHFLGQRVRQAYDDLAQPVRCGAELLLAPLLGRLLRRRPRRALAVSLLVIALAERGRRRHGGAEHFPWTAALWAPLWLLERSVTVWVAMGCRARGGVRYRGGRLRNAGHSLRRLAASPRRPLSPSQGDRVVAVPGRPSPEMPTSGDSPRA